ncbi:hypothetical protein ACFVVX_37560 [Kitasatospora sp. NPDC058170]|uniref:hypothetical protein n=1 Tax=Kitasatospora sp. NPDC058170 TaxID=3346364 RepID=UPI0036DAD0C9
MRKIVKAAATAAVGGALLLGFTGSATAAALPPGPVGLGGKGCPAHYWNQAQYGSYDQYLQYTYVGGNGVRFGLYAVYFNNPARGTSYDSAISYTC